MNHGARLLGQQFLSHKQEAAALGISGPYLSALIWGRKVPSIQLAAKIEARYGIAASSWARDEKESVA